MNADEIKADLARRRMARSVAQSAATAVPDEEAARAPAGANGSAEHRHEEDSGEVVDDRRIVRMQPVATGGGIHQKVSYLPDIHRLLPQSPDAEMGVLSSFLLVPVDVGRLCEEKQITPAHFHLPSHALIFKELMWLWRERMPIDFITLTQILRDHGQLEACGGAAYVTSLFVFLPTAANARYYLEVLEEKFTLREIIRVCTEYAARSYDEQDQVPFLLAEVSQKIEGISKAGAHEGLEKEIDGRAFDASNPPAEPPAVLMLGEAMIATPENFMVIQAKVKAGKTAALGAIIAATMEPTGDCLGFSSCNQKGHAVIHFDTEQSRFDHHRVVSRALWRAGRTHPPPWLFSYYLKGMTVAQRLLILRSEMERRRKQFGGIFMVLLDGIADYCNDVNDPEEAFALVAEIERLGVEFQTLLVVVIHENPGTDIGKTRGHLGSHLERKAETPLRLEKDADGVTVMFAEKARNAHITKANGVRFTWSDEAKTHVRTEAQFTPAETHARKLREKGAPRANAKIIAAKTKLGRFFAHGTHLRRSLLLVASKIPESSFDNYWNALKHAELIACDPVMKSIWCASPDWAKELESDYPDDDEPSTEEPAS